MERKGRGIIGVRLGKDGVKRNRARGKREMGDGTIKRGKEMEKRKVPLGRKD